MQIVRASAEGFPLRLALSGPAGSGKTASALMIAAGIGQEAGKRVAFIDTESRRSRQYAKDFEFDVLDLEPPFNPSRYAEAIKAIEAAGEYAVVVVDSMSHEHEGEGGLLDMAEAFLDAKAGNDWSKRERLKMAAWIEPKKQRAMLFQGTILRTKLDVVLCFRAKEKTKPIKDNNGKLQMVNVGIQPIGGEEYPYAMHAHAVFNGEGKGVPDWSQASSRFNTLDQKIREYVFAPGKPITVETGVRLKKWANSAEPKQTETPNEQPQDDTRQRQIAWCKKISGEITTENAASLREQHQKHIDMLPDDLKNRLLAKFEEALA